MATLSIVSPFYNEQESAAGFAALIGKLAAEAKRRYGLDVEIVLVDDGSVDGSADAFAASMAGRWKIVRLSRNFGKEIALFAGMEHATGDLVLLMDADLQHSQDMALRLVDAIMADPQTDVVHAVRAGPRDGWRRDKAARLFYRLINVDQRFDIMANSGDFRIMRRPVVNAFLTLRDRKRFNKGLYAWAGFRQTAIAYTPADRVAGHSHWSRLGLLALSLDGFTSFSVLPLRVLSLAGLFVAACGMLYGAKIVLEVLITGIDVPGFASVIVAVVVIGGFNLALLGLIGEYLWVAISEIKDRPIYIVRDVVLPEKDVAAGGVADGEPGVA
jgi:glycosyltransferase involved in cell wall biosynthesis